jgi:hypothetical protein
MSQAQTNSLIQQLLMQQISGNAILQNILQNLIGAIHQLTGGINALINAVNQSTSIQLKALYSAKGGSQSNLAALVGASPRALSANTAAAFGQIDKYLLAQMSAMGGYTVPPSALVTPINQPHAGGRPQKESFNAQESFKNIFSSLFGKGEGGLSLKTILPGMPDFGAKWKGFKEIFGSSHPILSQGPKLFGALGQAGRSIAKMPFQAIGAMGPQMAAMSLVMQPVMAFLEGFLSPFEFLGDMFGAFGEILGMMFLPIVQMLVPMMAEWIPILMQIALALQPVIEFMFNLVFHFSGLSIIFGVLQTVIESFMPVFEALKPIFDELTPVLELLEDTVDLVMIALDPLISLLSDGLIWVFQRLETVINYLMVPMGWLVDTIQWLVDTIESVS